MERSRTERAEKAAYMRNYREQQVYKTQEKKWKTALAELPETERDTLLAQAETFQHLMLLINDVCRGVRYGNGEGIAGDTMCFPDLAYIDVKEFIARCPLVVDWCPDKYAAEIIANIKPDFFSDATPGFDDTNFVLYGLRTRLVRLFWKQFVENVSVWAEKHPDDCEPRVLAEVAAILGKRTEPKAEASVIPKACTSEEAANRLRQEREAVTADLAKIESPFVRN